MNAHAYNDCVRELSDSLYRFVCKHTGNEETAKDVVQASFEVLWNKRGEVPEGKGKAFLFQVAFNQAVSEYRAASRNVYDEVDEGHSVTQVHHGLQKALDTALQTLDTRSRALVLLKDYEGYNYAEIGALTGLNESQVKVYLFRARKKLQAYIGRPENVL